MSEAERLEGLREALAVWLMSIDECDLYEAPHDGLEPHFSAMLTKWRDEAHGGDCPHVEHPAPITCMRCVCDGYLARADALLALLTALQSQTPGPTGASNEGGR